MDRNLIFHGRALGKSQAYRDLVRMSTLINTFEQQRFDRYRQGIIDFYEYRAKLVERYSA